MAYFELSKQKLVYANGRNKYWTTAIIVSFFLSRFTIEPILCFQI